MAISNIGVGSGLPLDQLLDDFRKSENLALNQISTRAKSVQNRFDGYSTIKGSIEALKKASEALGKADAFGALKTSVNGEAFTASASTKAVAGQYTIEVQQLATSQTLTSKVQASRDTALDTGTGTVDIEIKVAGQDAKTLTLNATDTSLEGIVKAINGDSSLGVSATLINNGEESYLMLTAKGTGAKAAVESITSTSASVEGVIGFNVPGTPVVSHLTEKAAQNSIVEINDIKVESQTNTLENAIEGVTLTLTKTNTAGSPDTLSVTRDDAVTSKAVNDFVNAYNNLQGVIKALTTYNVDNPAASGSLSGDGLARNVQNQIRNALNVANESGPVRTLSQLGVTTDPKNGQLVVDTTKLNAALKDNMVDVQNLFAGDNGISKKLGAVADNFVKSGGVISSASDSMTQMLKNLEKQYDATSDRIDVKMEGYRRQFSAMDSMVAQMGSISSYLTQQLSMLGNLSNNNK